MCDDNSYYFTPNFDLTKSNQVGLGLKPST